MFTILDRETIRHGNICRRTEFYMRMPGLVIPFTTFTITCLLLAVIVIWLAMVVVLLFSAFPRAFSTMMIALHIPISGEGTRHGVVGSGESYGR